MCQYARICLVSSEQVNSGFWAVFTNLLKCSFFAWAGGSRPYVGKDFV